MKRIPALTLLLTLFLSACGTPATPTGVQVTVTQPPPATATKRPAPRTLNVFAAASLTQAFGEIDKDFEGANPGDTVNFNFAGSQTLVAQVQQGASPDVFASDSSANMDNLVTGGEVDQAAPKIFLTDKLVVILPPNNPADVQSLQDLAKPGLKVVLADGSAPAGKNARQVLNNMGIDPAHGTNFSAKVLANVVSNETDVKLVVSKVVSGGADAGIVYASDAIAEPTMLTIEIPANLNGVSKYSIAPLSDSANPELAAKFIAYVLSDDGQAILKKWGFTPVK